MSNFFTALGTSAAIPTKTRSCSAYYLQIDGDRVLIDCGEGTQRQLVKYVQNGFRLTKIFISHAHADHVLGLPGLLFSMNLNGRNKLLEIIAPVSVNEWIKSQISFFDIELNYEIKWTVLDTSEEQLLWRGINFDFVSFPLDHTAPCAGLVAVKRGVKHKIKKSAVKEHRLNVEQIKDLKAGKDITLSSGEVLMNDKATFSKPSTKLFAYVSDTRTLSVKSELLSGVHYMIHESTFCEDLVARADITGHSTANQAASFAKDHDIHNLYLTHFSSRYQHPNSFYEEAIKVHEPIALLADGQKIPMVY